MSEYTISLNGIIDLLSDECTKPFMKDKIEQGRKILFNFEYEGDAYFKERIEKAFIIKHIDDNICYSTYDRWLYALEEKIKLLAPTYYKRYLLVKNLKEKDLTINSNEKITHNFNNENSGNSKNNSKSLQSNFPKQIETGTFNSINYMDSGAMDEESNYSSGKASGNDNTIIEREQNKFINIEKYNTLIKNIIDEFIYELRYLFCGLM